MFQRIGTLLGYVSDKPSRRGAAVAASVVGFGCLETVVHNSLAALDLPPFTDSLLDGALVGMSFGLAVWVLLVGNFERRRRLREDVDRLAELNHEIRNALQVIADSHFDADVQHRRMVMDSVNRIDAVLKRLYPVAGGTGSYQESESGAGGSR